MSDLLDKARRDADLEAHRQWHDSAGAEGAPASWSGEDLSGDDLTGAILSSATLIEARLVASKLDHADLSAVQAGGADFEHASLRRTNLARAVLVGARFDGATAQEAVFRKASLGQASFQGANLAGAMLDGASCSEAVFRSADLSSASLWTTLLPGADLSDVDLTRTRFERTVVDFATRFDRCSGLDSSDVVSIIVGSQTLLGDDARQWIRARAAPLPWSVVDFELYLLSKMEGEWANAASAQLCPEPAARARIVAGVASVFERMPHAAIDYERVIGPSRARNQFEAAPPFYRSTRHEFLLPLWPEVMFIVNTDVDGLPWGVGFEGGRHAQIPVDLMSIEPGVSTSTQLRQHATSIEILDQWDHDLDAVLTIQGLRFRARFTWGLLQSWSQQIETRSEHQ